MDSKGRFFFHGSSFCYPPWNKLQHHLPGCAGPQKERDRLPSIHFQVSFSIHPGRLTYPLKRDPWKRRFLLETTIFRGYVSLRECNFSGVRPWVPCHGPSLDSSGCADRDEIAWEMDDHFPDPKWPSNWEIVWGLSTSQTPLTRN